MLCLLPDSKMLQKIASRLGRVCRQLYRCYPRPGGRAYICRPHHQGHIAGGQGARGRANAASDTARGSSSLAHRPGPVRALQASWTVTRFGQLPPSTRNSTRPKAPSVNPDRCQRRDGDAWPPWPARKKPRPRKEDREANAEEVATDASSILSKLARRTATPSHLCRKRPRPSFADRAAAACHAIDDPASGPSKKPS
jgi:hypothetical protein